MRQITRDSVNAFINGKKFKRQNMEVCEDGGYTVMKLHGHIIARYSNRYGYELSDCGYQSNTTKERLNGLIEILGFSRSKIYQKNWAWYFDKDGERKSWDYAYQSNGFVSFDYMRGV